MFDYTRAAFIKSANDFKKCSYVFNIFTQIIYMAYLAYAFIAGMGNLYVNIVLSCISVSYFIFYIATYDKKEHREAKKIGTRAYKWLKISVKLVALFGTVYGVYAATEKVSVLSVVMASLSVVFWILGTVITVICFLAEDRFTFLLMALESDIQPITSRIKNASDFVDKVKGLDTFDKGSEETEKYESKRIRAKLEKTVSDFRETEKNRKDGEKEKMRRVWKNRIEIFKNAVNPFYKGEANEADTDEKEKEKEKIKK